MLSFLSPLFLAGAAAAAVPIVLHLLKREPEARVKFAAVKLIKQAPVEHTDRRRLRELLLLALRVTALVLLALAFARPFLATGAAVGSTGVTVVALDTSYSLSAPGRFERAKQLAKEAIAKAPAGDLVGVVTFADEAEIVAKPGADRTLADDAIEQASPGFGATRYRAALSAASQHLAGRHGTVVVVTDLQENGWDAGDRASVPEGTTIQVADVGAMPPNLAVTAVRPLPDRVVATVHNGGPRPRDARVHLTIDDRPAGDAIVSLGANQSAEATFAGAPRGASAAVSVDDPDGIQADNVRYAVIGGTGKPSVLVVTGSGDVNRDAFYVQHALAAGTPADAAFQVAGVGGAAAGGVDRGSADAACGGAPALDARPRAPRARAAGGVRAARRRHLHRRRAGGRRRRRRRRARRRIDAAHRDGRGREAGGARAGAGRRPASGVPGVCRQPGEPRPGDVSERGAHRRRARARRWRDSRPATRRSSSARRARGARWSSRRTSNNRWNDFPLHATFVPFVHEVVRYLASARAHAVDYLIGDAPAGVKPRAGHRRRWPTRRGPPAARARSRSTSIRAKPIRRGCRSTSFSRR